MLTQNAAYDAAYDVEDRVTNANPDEAAAFLDVIIEELTLHRDSLMADYGIEGVWDLPELPLG